MSELQSSQERDVKRDGYQQFLKNLDLELILSYQEIIGLCAEWQEHIQYLKWSQKKNVYINPQIFIPLTLNTVFELFEHNFSLHCNV